MEERQEQRRWIERCAARLRARMGAPRDAVHEWARAAWQACQGRQCPERTAEALAAACIVDYVR
ncbi:MAG: hypothetical protein AB1666_06520 [Pseudomonadota bacterium]|uniref:hypothetical protein n=1 Tax=Caldimonas aquatica TaxID=376175 RepID=UPI0034973361